MLQHEFEELTGLKVSEKEYEDIEMVYMADPDIDKREFCAMWKNTPEPAQDTMIAMAKQHDKDIARMRQEMNEAQEQNSELLAIMFRRANEMGDSELRNACVKHMGIRAYLTKMLEDGYKLWAVDKNELMDILNA